MPNLQVTPSEADISKLENYFKTMPDEFESMTNKFMHTYAYTMRTDIQRSFSVGHTHPGGMHARTSDSLEIGELYLGFYVKTRATRTIGNWREYGYLIFPEEGRGPYNPVRQAFFDNAKTKHEPLIFERLKAILERAINK